MLAEINAATRICLICNPNNPTGTALPLEEIERFADELPRHVALIVDEAYVEFNTLQDPDESLALLKRHNNVVLLRTFSKVYGLCGLRVGYALCPEGFRDAVDRIRQPFSVNALAQAAAAEALLHQDEVARRVERTAIERLHMEGELEERGLAVAPSQANFCWVAVEEEEAVLNGLESRGVIVRGGAALGDPGHLRVTYGTRQDNERFLAALDDVLHKN
jgi:histidinol-phosphate aminotransferase